jgi:hypothetical protein
MTDNTIESAPVDSSSNVSANPTAPTSDPAQSIFDVSKYFGEDLRKDPDFERLSKNIPNDPEKLVKDLYHKTKYFGRAKDEVRKELEAELNKPTTYAADQYSYELPENYSIEDELLDSAKTKATELGIKPEQFKELMKSVFETDAKTKLAEDQSQKAADEEALASLKAEWGMDFEKKSVNAEKMLQFLTSPEEDAIVEKLPMEGKLLIAKIMEKVSQKISEPTIGRLESGSKPMTEEIFQSRAKEIRSSQSSLSEQTAKLNALYSEYYKPSDMNKYYTKTTNSRII